MEFKDASKQLATPAQPTGASGSVLPLDDLVHRLQALQPPPAYRISLDSGIEYKNVRRALANPGSTRLDTYVRVLRSLRIRLVGAARNDDLSCALRGAPLVGFGDEDAGVIAGAGAGANESTGYINLQAWRQRKGWSRNEVARRAGISVEALASIECGRGLVSTLMTACVPLELQLLAALSPGHDSLESLWAERAIHCLQQPAHYPRRWPRRV